MLFPSVRNLPDVTAENFSKVDLRQFKWIHWEVSEVWSLVFRARLQSPSRVSHAHAHAHAPPSCGSCCRCGCLVGLDVSDCITWLLFGLQGRNAEEQVKMIQQVEEYNSSVPLPQRITVSVEIEKTREPLYQLFPHAGVVRVFELTNKGVCVRVNWWCQHCVVFRCLSVKTSPATSGS